MQNYSINQEPIIIINFGFKEAAINLDYSKTIKEASAISTKWQLPF